MFNPEDVRLAAICRKASCAVPFSTILVGFAVAFAHIIPASIRHPILVVALAQWMLTAFASVLHVTVSHVNRSRRITPTPGFDKFLYSFGYCALLVAVMSALQLWLMRHVTSDSSLIWNVDWRYALSHARAIAIFGGLENSLDYAGAPIDYHVGPAWLAGAWQRLLGIGADETLFAIIPLVSTIVIGHSLHGLLRGLGTSRSAAVAATGAAMLLPATDKTIQEIYWNPSILLQVDSAPFGVGAMINVYFALAVGFSALSLLINARSCMRRGAAGAVGLGCLAAIKPQYFIGIGMLFGMYAAVQTVVGRFDLSTSISSAGAGGARLRLFGMLAALVSLVVLPKLLFGVSPEIMVMVGVLSFASVLWLSWAPSHARPGSSSGILLVYGFGAIALAIFLITLVPGAPFFFGSPRWSPGYTGWSDKLYFSISALLFLTSAAVCTSTNQTRKPTDTISGPMGFAWFTFAAIAVLTSIVQVVAFPVAPALLARGAELGGFDVGELRQHVNLAQSLIPLRLLLVASASAVILAAMTTFGRIPKILTVIAGVGLIGMGILTRMDGFVEPDRGFQAVSDKGLLRTLALVPVQGSLLISSDIADAAEDHRRPANATALPAYYGHSFYVSNLRYMNWVRPDAPSRLQDLIMFFGSSWSPWHDAWLASHGITHIMVSDRCQPVWLTSAGSHLQRLGGYGSWAAFRTLSVAAGASLITPDLAVEMVPKYGLAACLRLRQTAPETK